MTGETKVKIELSKVLPNPYRDYGLDPINPEAVTKLAENIGGKDDKEALGFWGGIAVRKVDDGYQLAFGHHRLEALRQLGWTHADLNLVQYDDDQMIKAMAVENATQRGGDGGAILDSVAGVIRRLGYLVLTKTDEELLNRMNPSGSKLFEHAQALSKAKSAFLEGKGFGKYIIHNYEPSLKVSAIQNALKTLNEANYMTRIAEGIQFVIAQEAAAAQAKADAMKQQKRKDEEQAKANNLKAQEQQAKDAASAAIVEQHYDPLCDGVFQRDSHVDAFRKIVTSDNGKKYIPLEQQLPMAKAILSDFAIEKGKNGVKTYLSADYIGDKAASVLRIALGMDRAKQKEENATKAAQRIWKKLEKAVADIPVLVDSLETELDKGGVLDTPIISELFNVDLKYAITTMEDLNHRINIADNVVGSQ